MIYIVEDDVNVKKSLEVLIVSYEFKCKSFQSGEEFLKEYIKGTDELMILDMRVNNTDVREFLMALREANIVMPIIGITAQQEPEIRAFCQLYGVKSILSKPVDSKALIDLIKYHN